MGCSKNLVDSELLMGQLEKGGIDIVHNSDSYDAKTVIINTCGFINDAKQESIDTILDFIQAKKSGFIDRVYVMGCLSQRYKKELLADIPEVDEYFGVNNIKDIVSLLDIDYKNELTGERYISTPSHYAYLKISEGCDRTCSFCAIPLIRGKHISRTIEDIINEAKHLVKKGVKEFILIAQDLTYYGIDIYKKQQLNDLINRLADITGVEWIRLHYAYPSNFPVEIIKTMKERDNVCKYLDLPVQHINNTVLKNMRRGHSKDQIISLLNLIKSEIPEIYLRTTVMVGHPGEGPDEFEELKQFIRNTRFDRLGAFTYSCEEDTFSAQNFIDTVNENEKQNRMEEIMNIQSEISADLNALKIGKTFKTIIDRKEGDYYIGRTEADSPEVDNEVIIPDNTLKTGSFYDVKIISANEFDLFGEL